MSSIRLSQQTIVFAIFIVLFLAFSLFLPGFFSASNIVALLQNVAILGILGLGMAVVVIGRGIDISMIAALAVPPGLLLQMVNGGYSVGVAFAAAIALVVIFGLVNGWLIAYAEVPSLFTTLASGLFLAGLGQVAWFTLDLVPWPPQLDVVAWFGRGTVAGIPLPVVMFGITILICVFLLRYTRFGTYLYATGDNPQGARTIGIPTRPLILRQYIFAALIAAFAGMVMAASIGTMQTRIYNSTMIYDVILIVVLGGIGLSGGRGGVLNAVTGTLLIGTLLNGMTILDMSYSAQNLIKGLILLIAILIDSIMNPRNEETAQQGDI